MVQGIDRRKYARLDLALTVAYRIVGQTGKDIDPIEALTSDVSIGGFRLMTPAPLESGTKLDLEIQLGEEGIPIHAEAEVMWQSKNSNVSYETGVQITHMPDKDKSQFMSFVFDQMSKIVGNHAIASGEKN